jgi:uncharacterized sporulation protein YeaH/YhbH (DUF444 family)
MGTLSFAAVMLLVCLMDMTISFDAPTKDLAKRLPSCYIR